MPCFVRIYQMYECRKYHESVANASLLFLAQPIRLQSSHILFLISSTHCIYTVWTLTFVVLNFCSFRGLTAIHESLVPRKFRPALTGQRMTSILMNSDFIILQNGYRGLAGVTQRRIASVSRHTRLSSAHDRPLRKISGQELQRDLLYCFLHTAP